jgi:hypothetical protein
MLKQQLLHLRRIAARKQAYRCYYCERPMCRGAPASFARRHGLSEARARMLLCTAEHLVPRSKGGKDCRRNIAAACLLCNAMRHRLPQELEPAAYAAYVRQQGAIGHWPPPNYSFKRTADVGLR